MINIDSVYITNLPAFYKINLFNRIAKKKRIAVIFTGDDPQGRNADFFLGNCEFHTLFLTNKGVLSQIRMVNSFFKKNKCGEIVLGGWDSLIYWFVCVFVSGYKSLIVESSWKESSTTGIKSYLKKIFLSRISKAYVPGKSNRILLEKLHFKGIIVETKGVGIFNIVTQPSLKIKNNVCNYLYVGRLSPEKNLGFLISIFNSLPHYTLNIVGFGPEESHLKSIANSNIHFLGAIDNAKLPEIYQANDVFILPSMSEPWGLVVEEALNNGLPVIVSNKVGCAEEIVNESNGLIFSLDDKDSLRSAIDRMSDISFYNNLKYNISKCNFEVIADNQVRCYL